MPPLLSRLRGCILSHTHTYPQPAPLAPIAPHPTPSPSPSPQHIVWYHHRNERHRPVPCTTDFIFIQTTKKVVHAQNVTDCVQQANTLLRPVSIRGNRTTWQYVVTTCLRNNTEMSPVAGVVEHAVWHNYLLFAYTFRRKRFHSLDIILLPEIVRELFAPPPPPSPPYSPTKNVTPSVQGFPVQAPN